MKIAIAGAGYVGLANAVLLAQNHTVVLADPNREKVERIRSGVSPIAEAKLTQYLSDRSLSLTATTDPQAAYTDADCVFIATPTNFCEQTGGFDTSSVEQVICVVRQCSPDALVVIKSTVPIGYTKRIAESTGDENLFFSPEFLREGCAVQDCFNPSRIIVGIPFDTANQRQKAQTIARLLREGVDKADVPVMIVGSSEAEAVKLFSNAYLAMRIGFFNELDSYAETHGLNPAQIIRGVGMDERIGAQYNNPGFGYGGYCLPKDTKQLLSDFADVPQALIGAVVASNEKRKDHIVAQILRREPETVGIYRLVMKKQSDNFRESGVIDVMRKLRGKGVRIVIYEPLVKAAQYAGYPVENDFDFFAAQSDVIVANRMTPQLEPLGGKVYTRDVFQEN